jgi:post-segregation antitoxin (ccd killing protein)
VGSECNHVDIVIRTQIQLTGEQLEALQRLAAERGVSVAALAREGIEAVLRTAEGEDRWARALAVVGRFRSDRGDVSERHDEYLVDAFSS